MRRPAVLTTRDTNKIDWCFPQYAHDGFNLRAPRQAFSPLRACSEQALPRASCAVHGFCSSNSNRKLGYMHNIEESHVGALCIGLAARSSTTCMCGGPHARSIWKTPDIILASSTNLRRAVNKRSAWKQEETALVQSSLLLQDNTASRRRRETYSSEKFSDR
jgi:hypothetical protein